MERRDFIRMLGVAPGALAASWHLDFARDKLISQVDSDEGQPLPDQSVFYRSLCTECPVGCGLRVKVRRDHPVKLEGDPAGHPGSGGLCLRGQASLARLYHPARLREPRARQADGGFRSISWTEALARVDDALSAAAGAGATSFYLAGCTTGAASDLIDALARRRHVVRLPEHELLHPGALRHSHAVAFGAPVVPRYETARADLIVTLGADLFEGFLDPVGFAAAYAEAVGRGASWIHIEPGLSLTGCSASERLVIRSGGEGALLAHLVHAVGAGQLPPEVLRAVPAVTAGDAAAATGLDEAHLARLRETIERKRGRVLTLCGGLATAQPDGARVALLGALLQAATGQLGRTVHFDRPLSLGRPGAPGELNARLAALAGGPLGVAFISRVHAFTGLPAADAALARASLRVGICDLLYPAMAACDLLLPRSHALETWVDARAIDGTHARHRPVFKPLFDTRSEEEILLALLGESVTLAEYLDAHPAPGADEEAAEPDAPALRPAEIAAGLGAVPAAEPAAGAGPDTVTLLLPASVRTFDGRSRPLTLLHEIPDPVSAVSYGDCAWIAVTDAERWRAADGDEIEIATAHGTLRLPARVQPGQPAGVVTVGVEVLGAAGIGPFALPIVAATGEPVRCLPGARVRATGGRGELAILSGGMDARGMGILPGDAPHHGQHVAAAGAVAGSAGARAAEGAHGAEGSAVDHEHALSVGAGPQGSGDGAGDEAGQEPVITLFQSNPRTSEYRWAMAIDLDKCIGCSACVAACYVENNIPVTGVAEHLRGREMSWLRIQPYLRADGALEFLPMLCQHCDYAPCETVCPVFATYHNPEGLNAQVYNRCVGTRYCANNCPYKARRFNWFSIRRDHPLDLMLNPEVSVRPKGVMEKCTFCVQRIRGAKDAARDEGRAVRDGDVVPACAETCPTHAIVFGNLLDPGSRVRAMARSKRAYRVLADLGTSPAVHYLSEDQGHES